MDVTQEEAWDLRDSMAKIVYERMFNWIISKVNIAISGEKKKKSRKKVNFIGLLDIFGFEIFQNNWFEQLWINYANEKLQQHFNNYMFQNEQQEYLKEELVIDHIKFKDNKKWIDLIEKNSSKYPSIFSLLDEFSILNKNKGNKNHEKLNDELIERFETNLIYNDHFEALSGIGSKKKGFIIHHFAGKVKYETQKFWEKNKDSVSPLIESLFAQGEHNILKHIFTDYIGQGKESEESQQIRGYSLAFQFKDQLNDLMKIINLSSPRYIRCIKPNGVMKPRFLESDDVRRQLICAGVLEAIRIRQIGYPIRKGIDDFVRRYKPILSFQKGLKEGNNENDRLWEAIMVKAGLKNDKINYQVGKNKVFMKEICKQFLERELGKALIEHTIIIQRGIKKSLFRKRVNRIVSARIVTRTFHKLHLQNKLTSVYALKFLKSKQIIVKAFQTFIKAKNLEKQRVLDAENAEKQEYELKWKAINEERKKLEDIRQQQKDELEKLDSNMSEDFQNNFSMDEYEDKILDESGLYVDLPTTPGNPEDEEFKYHDDAFKEELDDLSDYMDNDEVNILQEKIEDLENQVRIKFKILGHCSWRRKG